jgi:hypothetical protein
VQGILAMCTHAIRGIHATEYVVMYPKLLDVGVRLFWKGERRESSFKGLGKGTER